MNTANVTNKFLTLSQIDRDELKRCRELIEAACRYVDSHKRIQSPDCEQTSRLELLSAAYANKLWSISCESEVKNISAGDFSLSVGDGQLKRADRLWRELASASTDIFDSGERVFGVIK